jgi:Domain of unknown function (DUF6378)
MLPAQRAAEVVKDRQGTYGHPSPVYERVAPMWSEILETTVTPLQIALCMIALKLGRECVRPNEDNLTDICGYANVYEMMQGGDEGAEHIPDAS